MALRVTGPAVANVTVSVSKMLTGVPPRRIDWGKMKCQTTPPGGGGCGTPVRSWVNWLPTAPT
jgi:hypothetical protein